MFGKEEGWKWGGGAESGVEIPRRALHPYVAYFMLLLAVELFKDGEHAYKTYS